MKKFEHNRSNRLVRPAVALCLAAVALPGCGSTEKSVPARQACDPVEMPRKQLKLSAHNIAEFVKKDKNAKASKDKLSLSKSYKEIDESIGSVTKITHEIVIQRNKTTNDIDSMYAARYTDLLHSHNDKPPKVIALQKDDRKNEWTIKPWGSFLGEEVKECEDDLFYELHDIIQAATSDEVDPWYMEGLTDKSVLELSSLD